MADVPYNFLGLEPEYCNYQNSKIVILPVPFDMTSSWIKGSDKGPHAIIDASRNVELYDIENNSEAYRQGIYTSEEVIADSSLDMVQQVTERVINFLQDDKFIVTLGGEHSVSIGAIKAHAEMFSDMSVLHLDAHSDFRECYEDNPYSHACAMARASEYSKNIVSVGIRSMDVSELPNINRNNIFYAHEIVDPVGWGYVVRGKRSEVGNQNPDEHPPSPPSKGESARDLSLNKEASPVFPEEIIGIMDWQGKVVERLTEHVYISIDLDVFDPSIMPSTGTPEPGGLGWYQVVRLIDRVAKEKKIVGFDVVELCPTDNKAPDFMAAKLVYRVLNSVFTTAAG